MNTDFLKNTLIFRDLDDEELQLALQALRVREKTFEKDETVFSAGTVTCSMGLLLEGSVTIESNDMWGNRTILSHVGKGQFFAETYALLNNEPMRVDVTTNEPSRILFLDLQCLHTARNRVPSWEGKLIRNLLSISNQKNLHLTDRSFHISPKTIRGKVMAYLNTVSLKKGALEFDIPFDRQQLADYLCVERTALSKELGKMQKDGILSVKKNHFTLMQQ